jgi:hypothetical protein
VGFGFITIILVCHGLSLNFCLLSSEPGAWLVVHVWLSASHGYPKSREKGEANFLVEVVTWYKGKGQM